MCQLQLVVGAMDQLGGDQQRGARRALPALGDQRRDGGVGLEAAVVCGGLGAVTGS